MSGYLPLFLGFLGGLLFAASLTGRVPEPGRGAGAARTILHLGGLLCLVSAFVGSVVFA